MSRYKGCWTEIIAAAEQIPPAKLALTFAVIYTSASIFLMLYQLPQQSLGVYPRITFLHEDTFRNATRILTQFSSKNTIYSNAQKHNNELSLLVKKPQKRGLKSNC
ncbi:hypothetical protein [Yersinia sp. 2541 StPb PI]|uniref:hypothetical protein n=1 Tax=Yersinia sp. 2541 StPb PI TaxID=3117407 RepID=UPI003FA4B296